MRGAVESPKVAVKMFGEFSITVNGHTMTGFSGRTKRVWLLIQYLIARRSSPAGLERLLKDIWNGRTCGDPENALKNLVYRARTILRDLSGSQHQFIVFLNGTYAWNSRCYCQVDSEQFLKCIKKASDESAPEEKRIAWYRKAMLLYSGGFLPKSAYAAWAAVMGARYEEAYLKGISGLCGLLDGQQRYEEILPVCREALLRFPYEESIHIILLRTYARMGNREWAFDYYTRVIKTFYLEFGVDLGAALRPYIACLSEESSRTESDLDRIRNDLREKSETEGAFFCDYDMFKCLYNSQVRTVPRTGISVFLVLFTICSTVGGSPEAETLKVSSEKLRRTILASLRKGDAVAPASSSQFIVMLQTVTAEAAQAVVKRVMRKFRFEYRREGIRVTTKIAPLLA